MKRLFSVLVFLFCLLALVLCLYLRSQTVPVEPPVLPAASADTPDPLTAEPGGAAESAREEDHAQAVIRTEETVPVQTVLQSEEATAGQQVTAPDYLAAYAPAIRSYQMWLTGNEPEMGDETERGDYYLVLGETGISYLCRYVDSLGYALRDLDENGVPELIIGSDDENHQGVIFDLFTLIDGVPQRVVISSERVRYLLDFDDRIVHSGSGGASYSFIGIYLLREATIEMISGVVMAGEDQFFEIHAEGESILFERQPDDIRISRDEYFSRWDEMEDGVVPIALTPLV